MTAASAVSLEPSTSIVASPDADMLPLRAAARVAGVSESTLRRLVADGAVEAVKQGGSLRVATSTIVELKSGGTALRRAPSLGVREAERARGALAAKCFRLFASAVALEDIVLELEVDPDLVVALHGKWLAMRARTAAWLAQAPQPAPGPAFDHPAAQDGSCCPGHLAVRRLQEKT